MALYERIIGRDDVGLIVPNRIVPEVLAAVVSEFARDVISPAEARALLVALRCPLDSQEEGEVATLLATITGQPSALARLARYLEIRDVLFLARLQAPGDARPREGKTRLGG